MTGSGQNDQKLNVSSKAQESIVWSLVVGILLQFFQFAISIVIARLLEPRDFGIMGIAGIIIFYSNNISEFGFGDALVRVKNMTRQHVETFFFINFTISLFLFVAVFASANVLASFFNTPELAQVLRVLTSIFIISTFYAIPQALLRRNLAYKVIAKIDILKRFAGMSFTLAFAIFDFGYWALVYGTMAANLTAAIVIVYKAKWSPRLRFHVKSFKDIIAFATWNFISVQANILGTYLDKLIIGKILGPVPLGFYEKSFGISFMPVQHISQRIGFVMFSTFSRVKSDPDEVLHYFRKTITLTSFFCFPLLVGLYAVADHFVLVLLGEKWQPMIPIFKILLCAFVLSALNAPFDTLISSCGNYQRQVRMRIGSLLILLFLLLVFTKSGITYVAYIMIFYNLLLFSLSYYISWEVTHLPVVEFLKCIMPATMGSIFMLAIVSFCSIILCCSMTMMNLVILIFAGIISYTGIILFFDFREISFIKRAVRSRFGTFCSTFGL